MASLIHRDQCKCGSSTRTRRLTELGDASLRIRPVIRPAASENGLAPKESRSPEGRDSRIGWPVGRSPANRPPGEIKPQATLVDAQYGATADGGSIPPASIRCQIDNMGVAWVFGHGVARASRPRFLRGVLLRQPSGSKTHREPASIFRLAVQEILLDV